MFIKHLPQKMLLLFLGDAILISLAYFLSPSVRFGAIRWEFVHPSWGGALTLGIYLLIFYLADFYDLDIKFKSPKYLFRFLMTVSAAMVAITVLIFIFPHLKSGRGEFFISAVLVAVLTYSWRVFFEWWFKTVQRKQKKLLIVGAGWAGKTLYETIKDNPNYHVLGYAIDDNPAKWGTNQSPLVVGDSSVLKDMVKELGVDIIVIAITHFKSPELLKNTLDCKMNGVEVYDMPSFYEQVTGKVPVEHVTDFWLVSTPLSGVRKTVYTLKIKRVLDVILSSLGLVFSLLITIPTAIAIMLESPGPIFYRQKRTGLNEKPFDVIKFRSMTVDAEKNGAVWAKKEDPRVTRIGKVIRKLRIDEIPQMWNVLKGEMSFIGPRPERPEFVSVLNEKIPYYSLRHSVRPGITGWAQVMYPYGASEEDALEKLQYDLFYIKNLSPLLEFHILLKTVKVVLWGTGAR